MPAKDLYHKQVKQALINDGWTITDDPLNLPWGDTGVKIDLELERLISAQKGTRQIAVELKSFLGRSRVDDLEDALGQIVLYRHVLRLQEPTRQLYLAIEQLVYLNFFRRPHVELLLREENIRLLVFDPVTEEIVQWID